MMTIPFFLGLGSSVFRINSLYFIPVYLSRKFPGFPQLTLFSENTDDVLDEIVDAAIHGTNIARDERSLYQTNENGRTQKEGVFAAGDVVTGLKTVAEAIAFARRGGRRWMIPVSPFRPPADKPAAP